MRIVVVGGGVVGVTTACQLQKDGHDVVALERNSEVAAEASWGNAGMAWHCLQLAGIEDVVPVAVKLYELPSAEQLG